jgi:hypothetical protein
MIAYLKNLPCIQMVTDIAATVVIILNCIFARGAA